MIINILIFAKFLHTRNGVLRNQYFFILVGHIPLRKYMVFDVGDQKWRQTEPDSHFENGRRLLRINLKSV